MKRQGLFITGTDTDVGKTVIAAAVLAALRNRNVDAVPMKPIQTGCDLVDGRAHAPDLEFCLTMASLTTTEKERQDMSPFCFEPACSPHLAASMAGIPVSPYTIVQSFESLTGDHDMVIVEGAGGLLVPISDQQTMLDLVLALELDVVLVARAGLGTLNHTFLSLSRLEAAGVSTLGVVLNHADTVETDYIAMDNRETIERMGNVPVYSFPFIPDIKDLTPHNFAELADSRLGDLVHAI